MVAPPPADVAMGLAAYLIDEPGIGGRLRAEPEDFRVIEVGEPPRPGDGPFTAARVRLRNWETNRFAGRAARELGIKPQHVGFAGMKDKRAVTEQWFTFRCAPDRLERLDHLQDVHVLDAYTVNERQYAGAHAGNRFELRVRDHQATQEAVDVVLEGIRSEGGVPHFFGPQRFGNGVRPITHQMGELLLRGDLEGAVGLYCGTPYEGEREDTHAARSLYEETRDPAAALDIYPRALDLERSMLKRLVSRPDDWRNALMALPKNLLTLFVHAHQSWIFNHVLSARLASGLGIRTAHEGDLVMPLDGDGRTVHEVNARNQARIQKEIDAGRAAATAPLLGTDTPRASGEPGEIEARTIEELGIDVGLFRAHEMPMLASTGLRRTILQAVVSPSVDWVDGDPVVGFTLGRGSYATVVMREIMKAEPGAY